MTAIDRSVYDYGEASRITFTNWFLKGIEQSLKRLYASFENQGPERKAIVELVQKQDQSEAPYVTHFVAMNGVSALAHAQILLSEPGGPPLHIETEWPGQLPPIPGKKRGEVGRLFIFAPQDVNPRVPVEGYRHWQGMEAEGSIVRVELLRRMFAWAKEDAGLDSLSFQVNSSVLTILKRMGVNIAHGNQYTVSKNYEGEDINEYVVVFEKDGIKKVQDDLMRKSLRLQLEKFLAEPEAIAAKLILRFNRNEIRSLLESGLFGSGVGSGVGTGIGRTLSLLKNKPLQVTKPTFLRLVSADLKDNEEDKQGFLKAYRLAPKQTGAFPSLSQLLKAGTDFHDRIFTLPNPEYIMYASVMDLHFSRAAAQAALASLNEKSKRDKASLTALR